MHIMRSLVAVLLAICLGLLTSLATASTCEGGCEAIRLHYARFSSAMANRMAATCLNACRNKITVRPTIRPTWRPPPTQPPPTQQPPTRPTAQPTPDIRFRRCGQGQPTNRIMGGNLAEEYEFPWMAALSIDTWNCAGTIVDEWHILTAAHCLKTLAGARVNFTEVTVKVGSSNLLRQTHYKAGALKINPRHIRYYNDYDVAMVKLQTKLTFGVGVQAICLPYNINDVTPYDTCLVAGWGSTDYVSRTMSTHLRKVHLPLVSQAKCSMVYVRQSFINDLKLCAGDFTKGGIDACKGDSGGPFMCRRNGVWYQFGIVSFGVKCGLPYKPGVYTRVANPEIINFIRQALAI